MATNAMQYTAPTFFRRMRTYLREMFPVPERLVHAAMLCASFAVLFRLAVPTVHLEWWMLILGTCNALFLALILRLMDELKDLDVDRRLFPERAVPSGRVREGDIQFALAATIAAYVLVNVTVRVGSWSALGLLGYALLMYKYFFLPKRWKAQLPVNLLTHNPVVVVLLFHFVHLLSTGMPASHVDPLSGSVLLLIGMYWGLFLSWEIARKIRYPEEETEYVTYSKILGTMGSAATAGGVQTFTFAVGLWLSLHLKLSPVYPLLLCIAYLLLLRRYVQFGRGRLGTGMVLKAASEQYAALVMAAPLVERLVKSVVLYVS